jgi:hypothetical protein
VLLSVLLRSFVYMNDSPERGDQRPATPPPDSPIPEIRVEGETPRDSSDLETSTLSLEAPESVPEETIATGDLETETLFSVPGRKEPSESGVPAGQGDPGASQHPVESGKPTAPPTPPGPGDRFVEIRFLGQGGMGRVIEAEDTVLRSVVAERYERRSILWVGYTSFHAR